MHRMIKHIAPRSMVINGEPAPCECTETVTCAFCIQANLALMKKKYQEYDDRVQAFIARVQKEGLRISARRMGVDKNTLGRWLKSGNVPANIIEKYEGAGNISTIPKVP